MKQRPQIITLAARAAHLSYTRSSGHLNYRGAAAIAHVLGEALGDTAPRPDAQLLARPLDMKAWLGESADAQDLDAEALAEALTPDVITALQLDIARELGVVGVEVASADVEDVDATMRSALDHASCPAWAELPPKIREHWHAVVEGLDPEHALRLAAIQAVKLRAECSSIEDRGVAAKIGRSWSVAITHVHDAIHWIRNTSAVEPL